MLPECLFALRQSALAEWDSLWLDRVHVSLEHAQISQAGHGNKLATIQAGFKTMLSSIEVNAKELSIFVCFSACLNSV